MLAYYRPLGHAIEETRQGRTQKLCAHYASRLPWNQEGPVPSLSVILGFGGLPIELDRFGDFLEELGDALLAPRIDCRAKGKHRGPGQGAGAASVSQHPPLGAKAFIMNDILQRINVTQFQCVTVIALHVITLSTLNRVPVLALWRYKSITSHRSTVLPLRSITFMRF